MQKYELTKSDFEEKLDQQVELLKKSCQDFDNGLEISALHSATSLRVLIHDTKNSISLFTHLNMKSSLKYISSVMNYTPANMVSHFGLGIIQSNSTEGKYTPNIDIDFDTSKLLCFDDWWNEIVLSDLVTHVTRKDIVLGLADKEGGAHVDDKVDVIQRKMTKENGLVWEANGVPIMTNTYFVSIRVIAQELLETLTFNKEAIFVDHYIQRMRVPYRRSFHNGQVYFSWIYQKEREMAEKLFSDPNVESNIEVTHFVEKYKLKSKNKTILITKLSNTTVPGK